MHLPTAAFLLIAAQASTGFALPSNLARGSDNQVADLRLIQAIISKTGHDLANINAQAITKLAADDAQILSAELNKFAINHGQPGLVIPPFSNEVFEGERSRSPAFGPH